MLQHVELNFNLKIVECFLYKVLYCPGSLILNESEGLYSDYSDLETLFTVQTIALYTVLSIGGARLFPLRVLFYSCILMVIYGSVMMKNRFL
ncbi:hypothetical protein T4D_12401 [Trichinella pseudospiralis]|uniref:Uncharacterized protein n=1 Tax=Trichinella pseudospiralis TaxID=6337 RepID=A0A0V1FN61_TRIPS|nr:hypothetical protein T4D_12401 [Trichinella pseudospiralis]